MDAMPTSYRELRIGGKALVIQHVVIRHDAAHPQSTKRWTALMGKLEVVGAAEGILIYRHLDAGIRVQYTRMFTDCFTLNSQTCRRPSSHLISPQPA